MHIHVQVRPSTEGHPDGPVELQVKDKTVVLSKAEAEELANALLDYIPMPEPAAEPPVVHPELSDAAP